MLMPHGQNTVHVTYRVLEGDGTVRFNLRPSVHFRGYEAPVDEVAGRGLHDLGDAASSYELVGRSATCRSLRMMLLGDARGADARREGRVRAFRTRWRRAAATSGRGSLWSPGYFRADAQAGEQVSLIASTEPWDTVARALARATRAAAEHERRRAADRDRRRPPRATPSPPSSCSPPTSSSSRPAGRIEEAARARAAGDEVRTVIAGYHWFTDWGRDTMISLEGLTLATGRYREAGYILRTFAHYVRDGLIPNMFPDGQREGLYHTADATLWFFHAHRALHASDRRRRDAAQAAAGARSTSSSTTCAARASASASIPRTACFTQGAEGYQLTWMDAKVGDWVVTPRRGKAVEINALWYNALCLLAVVDASSTAAATARTSPSTRARARESFNQRFWYEDGGYLYDVVDGEHGDDACCRPNQVFAISLPHPVLDRERWEPVMEVVRERLLTPVGLRSLAPGDPDYKARYYGDLRARDAAYHQGTVWALADRPVHRRVAEAARRRPRRRCASCSPGFDQHLDEACVGSDQRGVRRRGAVPAARLRRAGVERRGSAALLAASSS